MSELVYSLPDMAKLLGSSDGEPLEKVTGEKTATLVRLNALGIEIPLCFSISTKAFKDHTPGDLSETLWSDILKEVAEIEKKTGFKLGAGDMPLLLSCRCDAPFAMPGMLDTVINIGLNDLTSRGLCRISNNRGFVWDSYRRLIQSYGVVVLKIEAEHFENLLVEFMQSRKRESILEFSDLDWIEVAKLYKSVIMRKTGNPFPQDPRELLKRVVKAMLESYDAERTKCYREYAKIPQDSGLSILVSVMKFGNNGKKSCSAVVASRSPVDGSADVAGEFVVNASIKDVSENKCPVKPIQELKSELSDKEYDEMKEIVKKLEKEFKVPQLVEFVNDNGRITVLQARELSCASIAKFRAIWEMSEEGLITKNEALEKIKAEDLKHLMMPKVSGADTAVELAHGLCAGNESVVGKVCLSLEALLKLGPKENGILVKEVIVPNDFKAVLAAKAIVTAKGGNYSHSTLIARKLMKTAAIGCELKIDREKQVAVFADHEVKEGDFITVTGDGKVFLGELSLKDALGLDSKEAAKLLDCADEARKGKMLIYTVARTPAQVRTTKDVGGDGVGMFPLETLFAEKSSILIRALLDKRRTQALIKIEGLIEKSVTEILKAAAGIKVAFRLFCPPFYTFMQNIEDVTIELAKLKVKMENTEQPEDDDSEEDSKESKEIEKRQTVIENLKTLQEANPIFGLKGIRLNLVNEDFLKCQIRGILKGIRAIEDAKPQAQILLPMVDLAKEITKFKEFYKAISLEIGAEAEIGSEVCFPRACLAAKSLMEESKFMVIRPDELTEAVFAGDRTKSDKSFIDNYRQWNFLTDSPFSTIDRDGVGKLIKLCVNNAKSKASEADIGVAGDLCSDPRSIAFFFDAGVSSITCDYAVVPIVRLCSAQAIIAATAN